jgi:hypothetical protein
MRSATCLLALLAFGAIAPGAVRAGDAVLLKDCRVHAGPGGPKTLPGCDLEARSGPRETSRLRQQEGFVDLGNGTRVRIGGRVRMDVGVRR